MAKKDEKEKDDTATTPDEETHKDDADAETEDDSEAEDGSGDSDESDDDSNEDADSKNLDDWKKIAQDERDRRKKAEKALAQNRYKGKRRESDDSDDADDSDGEDAGKTALTGEQLRKILQEEREATRKEVLSGRTKEIARELANSDEEADAIVEIFNNRSFPDYLSHEEKVREAYFIAHGPRLLAKRDELRRSLKSKDTASKGGNENAHRDAPRAGEPKLEPQDRAEFGRLGFKWDGKRYSKKLSNGKTLVKDPKTKKVFVQG